MVAVVAGALLILVVLGDAIGTLIVTRGRTGRWRPTRVWYAVTWVGTRAVAARAPSRLGDFALNIYPALSLLGLLVIWLAGLTVGWSLVYLGLGATVDASAAWGTLLYYSGAQLLTVSFASSGSAAVRGLSIVETLTGLGTIALLISYLPALYGAYSRRESLLLTLDDPSGSRLTPARVIAVQMQLGGVDTFDRFCSDWERWTAEVLESHVSYPMLALFRSQHEGQSWITALGVVLDAATLASACIVGAEQREPFFLHRRGRRAVVDIAGRLNVPEASSAEPWLSRANFDLAWSLLVTLPVHLRDQEDAWKRLQALRATYAARLQELIDHLLAPHGFWGLSAEATVAEEVAAATREARVRQRRLGSGTRG